MRRIVGVLVWRTIRRSPPGTSLQARPFLRAVLTALVATLLSCGSGPGDRALDDDASGDATRSDARSDAHPDAPPDSDGAAYDATVPDAAPDSVPDVTLDASAVDATLPPESDAGADDAQDALGMAPDGAVLCRLASDCAGLPATFCQKDSCDPAVIGTCALPPGTGSTPLCSPADGGGIVCGCDGQVYGYACLAHAQKINIASTGACPLLVDGGPCATNADCPSSAFCKKSACDAGAGTCEGTPSFQACLAQIDGADATAYACGCDHGTYYADCEAQNAGINIDHEGACAPLPSGPCTSQDDCGGAGYQGQVFCRPTVCGQPAGTCTPVQEVCPVSSLGDDVCGCDGRSYVNECTSTWQLAGIAYGGGCRDAGIAPCDAGADACAPGQACVVDPRSACTGPACPGVCVTAAGPSLGAGFTADGGYFSVCDNTYTTQVTSLVSQTACDGGPCASCGYTTGTCEGGLSCPGPSYCWSVGCTATGCSGGYCAQTIPGCAMCAYRSGSACDANTACPPGQLCFPGPSCDGGACPGVCVVP